MTNGPATGACGPDRTGAQLEAGDPV